MQCTARVVLMKLSKYNDLKARRQLLSHDLIAVFALSCAAFASGEESWCRCALFVSTPSSEIMAEELPEVPIDNCESHNQCRDRCTEEFNEMTANMDLWATVNGDTVGQEVCESLYSEFIFWVHNSMIY